MSAQMWIEYAYRNDSDGGITPMGLQFRPDEKQPDVFLEFLDGEHVTPVKRYVTAGEWERVNP